MKHINIFFIILPVLFLLFLSPIVISAQEGGRSGPVLPEGEGGRSGPVTEPVSQKITFENPLSIDNATVSGFIEAVITKIVVPIGAVVSVVFIIYAGFLFVTAQGSDDKLKSAKTALLNAIIGTIIILGAWTIAQVIKSTIQDVSGNTVLLP